jgi:hypothetical protein
MGFTSIAACLGGVEIAIMERKDIRTPGEREEHENDTRIRGADRDGEKWPGDA